jgi:3-methyl-2-oxobutanoate hydroxymethyltransferase
MTTTQSPHKPKFVRRFADAQSVREAGVKAYADAVRARTFPDPTTEGYAMPSEQWTRFLEKAENIHDTSL